jgi:hypothetical protein
MHRRANDEAAHVDFGMLFCNNGFEGLLHQYPCGPRQRWLALNPWKDCTRLEF